MNAAVVFVLKGYPRLSETFISKEILALERRGLDLCLFSLRRPTEDRVHPIHGEIRAPVTYLPEYLYREPLRLLRAWRAARRRPGYRAALSAWLKDLRRDLTANRGRRFGQALVLAHELPDGTGRIHAHFLHTPASVARYGAIILGLPWSCSAHAKDIWTTPDWEKAEKLGDCDWLVSCTRANVEHLAGLAARPERLDLVYHGLDLSAFPPPGASRPPRDGGHADDPLVILSVGRGVDKKGYKGLIDALALLDKNLHWRFVHIGGGPGIAALQGQAERLGLAGRVAWMGPQAQQTVIENYRAADIFVLACRISADGDRDGLPNVLMEAQSQELPCLSTTISGVPELIADGEQGLLVPPDDAPALAAGLERLIGDPGLRRRLGAAGLRRLIQEFSHQAGIDKLAAKFGLPADGEHS